MKIAAHCCFILCLIFTTPAFSQTIENSINLYGTNFPQEKIHIHFDKEIYLPGETIWFKAYLFEENLPAERSTNFYAALYDEDGKLIQQQISPIFNSTTDGHFDIPDSLQSRQLICRAYTTWMLNFDTSFLFTKAIKLINKNAQQGDEIAVKTTSLQFFPEGGDIIEGTRNTIAFKANYNNGLPFEINGVIKKQETGEAMVLLKSKHDGMGRFDLEIKPNERFYAEWVDNNGTTQQTYLPKTKPVGVSLKLVQQKNNLVFNIVNKLPDDSLHVLMYMYQKVFYKINLSVLLAEPYTGVVPIHNLPTGTMQLTVFDANWQPVAERMAFINNNNYTAGITITNKETSIKKRGKNSIEIEVADTIPANMSLSITDAEINNEKANSTIVTNLLLSADVKGYIHDPAYYFTNDTDAVLKAKLDLVMLTHGWRRYNWDDMLVQKMPNIYATTDNYLSAYGRISKPIMEKISKEENINLIVKTTDSTNNFYSIWPDSTGLLKQSGLIFYDTAKILFSFNRNKKWNTQVAFSSSNFTLSQPNAIYKYQHHSIYDTTGTGSAKRSSLFDYIRNNENDLNSAITLKAVVVKSKTNPLLKLDQIYTKGSFSVNVNTYSFDVLHDPGAHKFDIYDYLESKIPWLYINNFKGDKNFYDVGRRPVFVFIDEREAQDWEIWRISLEDIAYIKVFDNYVGKEWKTSGLYGRAISFYLKKGSDMMDRRPKDTDLKFVEIPGYSPLKEFYSPDYSKTNTTMDTDARTTVLWLPYILTDASNRKIPVTFYNNDFSKKLRLVLEGINDEGKLIHIEKIIE